MTLPPLFGPDFPSSIRDPLEDQIDVFWYHPYFTQNRYPPGQEISEACTLICLLVAQKIAQTALTIWGVEYCPKLNILIAEAILEGNKTHAWLVSNGLIHHPHLSTDEALKLGGLDKLKEWKFRVYRDNIEKALCQNIESFLHEWYQNPKAATLFMLLITRGRTVLFVFQEETSQVTLFDSHSHYTPRNVNRGLVLAQTSIRKLQYLCDWYNEVVLCNSSNPQSDQYELAFLYKKCSPTCCSSRNNKQNDSFLSCDCGCLER